MENHSPVQYFAHSTVFHTTALYCAVLCSILPQSKETFVTLMYARHFCFVCAVFLYSVLGMVPQSVILLSCYRNLSVSLLSFL